MDRLLIIGASILQLPAIQKAKQMGFYVGVVDYNPDAVGIRYADEYFPVSTIDVDGVVEVAKRFAPKGIVTLATDMPMRSVARACEACRLPGVSYETAMKATDKGLMIEAFEENGVAHPWFFVAEDREAFERVLGEVTYPCIMKPTDNAGSKGVVKCSDRTELIARYAYSSQESRSGAVIIEEYMEGPEFSVEVLVLQGQPYVIQITDKLTTGEPFFVEMGHSQPTRQPAEQQEKIRDLAVRAVRAVGILEGPAHVEMILTKDGPKMVELGARLGGDCITTHLVPLSTGIDMVRETIEIACGKTPKIDPAFSKGSAIRYLQGECGRRLKAVKGVEAARQVPGVRQVSITKEIGDVIGEIRNSSDRFGFVIAQGDTAQEAIEICEAAMKCIVIEYEETNPDDV